MNNDLATKPTKKEEFFKYAFVVMVVVYLFSLMVDWIHLNPWIVAISLLGLVLLLWYSSRTTPPWQWSDAVKMTKKLEEEATGQILNDKAQYCHVVPHGTRWYVHYERPIQVTYGVDPVRRVVESRQERDPDMIIRKTDESEVLRTYAADAVRKRKAAQELERAGIDTGEAEGENDE